MKKSLYVILCATLFFLIISCTTKAYSDDQVSFVPSLPTDKELSLNMIGVWGNFEAIEEVFQDFNKIYPNVSLSYEYVDNVISATENRCAVNDNIDLIFLNSMEFNSSIKDIADKYLVDFNKVNINLSAIDERYLKLTQTENGEQKFIPIYFETYGYLVNKTLLNQYGFDIPKNLQEFEEICDAFVDNGINPILVTSNNFACTLFSHLLFEIKNSPIRKDICEDLNAGKDSYNIYKDVMDKCSEWVKKGYFDFSGNMLVDIYNALILKFLDGNIPFAIATADTISGVRKREAKSESFQTSPFEYTFIPSPTGSKGMECVIEPSNIFSVYKYSENVDFAIEFMNFMVSEPELKKLTVIKGMPTVYDSTGDYRLINVESLSEDEKFFVGENDMSVEVESSLKYAMMLNLLPDMNPEDASKMFKVFMSRYK